MDPLLLLIADLYTQARDGQAKIAELVALLDAANQELDHVKAAGREELAELDVLRTQVSDLESHNRRLEAMVAEAESGETRG